MGWEAPIKTDISVAVMEATLQKKKIRNKWRVPLMAKGVSEIVTFKVELCYHAFTHILVHYTPIK